MNRKLNFKLDSNYHFLDRYSYIKDISVFQRILLKFYEHKLLLLIIITFLFLFRRWNNIYSEATITSLPLSIESIGDSIFFGHYEQDDSPNIELDPIEWLVLKIENNHVLLLSKYGLELKPYNKANENVNWETSSLREWLNGYFLNLAFTEAEKEKILSVQNCTLANDLNNNNNDLFTIDKVFLLSVDEAELLLTNIAERKCEATYHAKDAGANVASGEYWGDSVGFSKWWLRSSGRSNNSAAYVSYSGYIDEGGESVSNLWNDCIVRPAIWLNLSDNQKNGSFESVTCISIQDSLKSRFITNILDGAPLTKDDFVFLNSSNDKYVELGDGIWYTSESQGIKTKREIAIGSSIDEVKLAYGVPAIAYVIDENSFPISLYCSQVEVENLILEEGEEPKTCSPSIYPEYGEIGYQYIYEEEDKTFKLIFSFDQSNNVSNIGIVGG